MNMVVMIPTFILIAFGIGVVIYGVLNNDLDTTEFRTLYTEAYTSQLVNTPHCFAYEDPQTERVDYGVLDTRKITQERFIACLSYGEPIRQLMARMTISYLDNNQELEITTSNWFDGANVQEREVREVTILTNDLQPRQALIRIDYAQTRMTTP